MAVIPLNQTVDIHKPEERDDWGKVVSKPAITLKCRADERTELVKNRLGEEVASTVQLMFDKLPNIAYDDVIEYTNELDVTIKREPVKIEPIRMPNGKPILTEVFL